MKKFKEIYQSYLDKCSLGDKDFTTIKPQHIFNQILKLINKKDFETVKKIFEHPKYREYININESNDLILAEACKEGNIDFIQYLLLETGANIYAQKGAIFGNLILWKHKEVLEYLIFDYKIKETEEIKAMTNMFFSKDVKKMFQTRNLQENLSSKKILESRLKV